ncbi:MAG: CHAP domain-containing protein [Pseudomonadota bacterium]
MKFRLISMIAVALAAILSPIAASPLNAQSSGYLQCVPYARQLSGIQIYGDARTWWGQAEGRYQRGSMPAAGAVMVFKPYRNMRLGHVAYVSEIIDSRTVMLSHSNWSTINCRRGQIERNVPAIDVSPNNDWSKVRVWYQAIQAPGGTHWPLEGFIYASNAADPAPAPKIATRREASPAFTQAFAGFLND